MELTPTNQQFISSPGSSSTKWIVVALIGLVVIGGGFYLLTSLGGEISSPTEENAVNAPPASPPPHASATNPNVNVDEAIVEDIRQVSTGSSAKDIQADIDATDIQVLDEELKNLEQEMKGL